MPDKYTLTFVATCSQMKEKLETLGHGFCVERPQLLEMQENLPKRPRSERYDWFSKYVISKFVVMDSFQHWKIGSTNPKSGIRFLILLKEFLYKYVMNIMY